MSEKTKTIYPIALHTSYAMGITKATVHVFCISSHDLIFVLCFMKICQAVLNLWSGHKNC